MQRSMLAVTAALVVLGGCAMGGDPAAPIAAAAAPSGIATLADAAGGARGSARIVQQQGSALRLTYDATGLPPGVHGIHVHTVGRCDVPDFQTAGGHWNPTAAKHGSENPQGPHRGDLPNLIVAADGSARYEATLTGAMLTGDGGLLDGDGASVIVHAAADDGRSDPAGNSGARIACGVVRPG